MANPVTATTAVLRTDLPPITATLRGKNRVFEVRSETSTDWLTSEYFTMGHGPGPAQDAVRKSLERPGINHCIAVEKDDTLWVTHPSGFWLKDGRLGPPELERSEADVVPYYGTRAEIEARGRVINFILDGPNTCLPKDFPSTKPAAPEGLPPADLPEGENSLITDYERFKRVLELLP